MVYFHYIRSIFSIQGYFHYTECIKKLNKSEITLRLCKAPQCTKFLIEIGSLSTYDVELIEKFRNLKLENLGACVFYDQLKIACARNFIALNLF